MTPTTDQIRKYVANRFKGQRVTSTREVKLRCPFHEDKQSSFSFNVEKGVWKCFVTCGDGGLVDFEQKLNGGTPDEARARIAEVMDEDHLFDSQNSKPTATYSYYDSQGRLLFEKLRYEPKRFVQRRPLDNGRYEYRLGDVEKPLYRLPDVLTANVVIICEGEKDADRVAALELSVGDPKTRVAATTNFDGAGKWREEYGIYFAGKGIVILPDNDDAGRRHAEMVAQSISKYAAGIRVLHLPGLPEKGDVSDYLNDHNAADLISEIKKAPPWRPKEQPHVILVEAAQFAASAPQQVEWLVDGVIQKGGNGIVVGEPKAAKSLGMIDLLISIATGCPWLGFKVPRRQKCALISREDWPGMTQQRIASLFRGTARSTDFDGWLWVNTRCQTPTFLLEDDSHIQRLIEELRMEQVEFACFDVFRKLHSADENDSAEMARILDQLTRIQSEANCAIALVHHTNKDFTGSIFRRIRGSVAIHGWTEWAIGISVKNPDDPPKELVRKVEFETKAASAANPKYFRIEGPDEALRLTLTVAPNSKGKTAASFMDEGYR